MSSPARSSGSLSDWEILDPLIDTWELVDGAQDEPVVVSEESYTAVQSVEAIFKEVELDRTLSARVKKRTLELLDGKTQRNPLKTTHEIALQVLMKIVKNKLGTEPLFQKSESGPKKPLIETMYRLISQIIHNKPFVQLGKDERSALVYEIGNRYSLI